MNEDNKSNKPVAPIHELLAKEVNRKEFLSIVGLGVLTVVGLGPIIKFLTGKNSEINRTIVTNKVPKEVGFGSGPYGV